MRENHIVFKNLNQYHLKIFNNIFKSNILKFNKLIDKVASYHKNDLQWLSQTILSRNNYLSNIYYDYCYLEVLKKNFQKELINVVYVNSAKEKKLIEINFSDKFNLKFVLKKKNNLRNHRTYRIFQNLYLNIKTSLYFFLNKSNQRKKIFLKKKKITLIENFLNKEIFDNKIYNDRFYGNFLSYLNKKEKEKVFFLFQSSNILKIKKHISILNKYNLNYITIFDFLNFFDYLFAIINSFKKKKFDTKRIVLNNINLEYLFNDLYQKTFNDINSFSSNLQFLFFKNLKKKTDDSKFYRIIDWYENQSTDKGFNFGLNKFFPKTQSIGYQPFAVDFDFYSHLISTKTERTNNITPNKIALMGQKIKIYLSKKFKLPSKKIILAPSLRYKSIFDKKKLIYKIKKTKYILLALPISYQDSSDILRVVQNYLKKFKKNNYKFFINFHPMLDIKKLRNNYKFIDKNIEIIQGSFNEIQSRFDCIISNSSSICFEALALSKPVLVVQNSKGITQNPISMVKKDTWEFIKNENDLQKAFIRLLIKKKKQSFINNSKFIKKKYFFEINRKNIIKFLGLS